MRQDGSTLLDAEVVVLMTSVGNEAIHGFAADLRRKAPRWRLVGVDTRRDAAGLYVCDHGHVVPRRDAPSFLPSLARICREHEVDVVLPLSTEDQGYFADPKVREDLPAGAVVTSPPAAVRAANSKIGSYVALREHADLLPEYEVAESPEEAMAALARLTDRHGAALLKAEVGTGARGMLCVGQPVRESAPTAGRVWWSLATLTSLVEHGGGDGSLPEPLSLLIGASAAQGWPRLAVQHLPGEEYSVDLLADEGEVLAGVVRLRHHAVAGLATAATTVDAPDVWQAAGRVTGALGLSYVNNIQFRRDADGTPKLMEINPRVPGTISLTVEAGLNLPLAACCLALGERIEMPAPETGVHVMRYFGSVFTRSLLHPVDED